MHKIVEILMGDDTFELEQKIFNIFTSCGLILAISSLLQSALPSKSFESILLHLLFLLLLVFSLYLSRVKKIFDVPVFLIVSFLVFIFSPFCWILNAGSRGGAQYYTILYGIMISAVTKGRKRIVFLTAHLLINAALFVFEYYFPTKILYYNSETVRYIDIIISITVASIANLSLFVVYAKKYEQEHQVLKEYSQRLKQLTMTDGMTGLYNHKTIFDILTGEITKAGETSQNLCIAMIDVDDFKNVNDTFGHQQGDFVLCEISKLLRENLEKKNLIGRYGGEEILMILPDTDVDRGYHIIDRIRQIIEQHDFRGCKVTVSGGLVQLQNEDTQQLVSKADGLMYEAKKRGKNRIIRD